MSFSWELSELDQLLYNKRKVVKLHRRFLDFTNRTWFSQLTNSDYGHALWKSWQETLETEKLFTEVKAQIQELDAYLNMLDENRASHLVTGLTVAGTILGFGVGLFSSNLLRVKSINLSLYAAAGLLCIFGGVPFVIILIYLAKWGFEKVRVWQYHRGTAGLAGKQYRSFENKIVNRK